MSLVITASKTTFAHQPLGNRVHGNEFDIVLVRVTHLREHFPETCEFYLVRVNVVLINLIGDNHELIFVTNLNNVLNIVPPKNLASGISRVDHDHGSEIDAQILRVFDSL